MKAAIKEALIDTGYMVLILGAGFLWAAVLVLPGCIARGDFDRSEFQPTQIEVTK